MIYNFIKDTAINSWRTLMKRVDDKEETTWAEKAEESGVKLSLGRKEGGRKGILVLLYFILSSSVTSNCQ